MPTTPTVPGKALHPGHHRAHNRQIDLVVAAVQHLLGLCQCRLAVRAGQGLGNHRLIRITGKRPAAPSATETAMARALPFGLLRMVGLLPLRRRHAGIVRCLRRLAELGFEFRNPPLSHVKSLPERSDQRIFLGVAQIIEVGELRHPAFRIDSTVTVSTPLLLPKSRPLPPPDGTFHYPG